MKAPLEGRGPLGAPVPDASLHTDTTLVVVDMSWELGRLASRIPWASEGKL